MGFSNQKTAIMTSIQTYKMLGNTSKLDPKAIGNPVPDEGGIYNSEVNFLLAGSIMTTLSLLIIGACCFLHGKLKTNSGAVALHSFPWSDENLEVYTLSGQEEITGIYLPPTPSPPPAYETVVKVHKKEDAVKLKKSISVYDVTNKQIAAEDDDLPSYETAIKLREDGYI